MVKFDDSLWPLLTVTFDGGHSDAEFDAYLETLGGYLARGEKYVTLFDAQKAESPSLQHRKRQADWIRQHEDAIRARQIGAVFVITSPLVRMALNVIYTMRPPPFPYAVVGDLASAREWAAESFRKAGLVLPSVLIRSHYGLARERQAV